MVLQESNKFSVHEEIMKQWKKSTLGVFLLCYSLNLCILNGLAPEARYNMGECRE